MSALSTIARGASFVFVGMLVSKFLSYLYRVIIARLGPSEYGLLSIGLALFGLLSVFTLLGLDTGVVRSIAECKSQGDTKRVKGAVTGALKISLSVALLTGIVLFFLAKPIAQFYHNEALSPLLRIFALILPLYAAREILLAAVRSWMQTTAFDVLVRNVGDNTLKLALTFLFLALGAFGAVSAMGLSMLLTVLSALYLSKRYLPLSFPAQEAKLQLLSYSTPLLFSTLLIQVFVWSGTLILGYYRPAADVGVFNAVLPTATLLSIIPGGIGSLFLPVMTELYTLRKMQEARITYQSASKWVFFLNLPIYVAMVAFAEPLLALIFGPAYVQGSMALIIVATSYIVLQTAVPAIETLKSIKKTHWVMLDTGTAAFMCILLSFLLVPQYGVMGGAIATGVSFTAYGTLAMIQTYYLIKLNSIQFSFVKGIIAATVSFFAGKVVIVNSLMTLFLGALVIALVYGITALLLRSLDTEDKSILVKACSKIKSFFSQEI